jgi:hypothetical protein
MKAAESTKMLSRLNTSVLVIICVLMAWNLHQIASDCPITPNFPSSPERNSPKVSTKNPSTGFFPGWNNGTIIDRESLDDAAKKLLPERMITVFGLESSGTSFFRQVLTQAVGATREQDRNTFISPDDKSRVQHFCLPNGVFTGEDPDYHRQFEPLSIIPVVVPQPCRLPTLDRYKGVPQPSPPQCHPFYGPTLIPDQGRYFVNVTTHINFYRQRGVDTTAVIVVRDPALHFRGITTNQTAAFEQYKTGRAILQHAMEHLDPESLIVVSYETLMTLKHVYLKEIYKALRIESDYIPDFTNGNIRYVPENLIPPLIEAKLEKDTGVPSNVVIPKNLYELKSLAAIQKELAKNSTT